MEETKPKRKPKKDYPAVYQGNYGPKSPYEKILGEEYNLVAKLEAETKTETRKWMIETWRTEEAKLLAMMQRTNIPAGQKLIASCLVNAIQCGDFNMLNTFLNRIVGKVREEISLTTTEPVENAKNARLSLLETICEPTFRTVSS